MKSILIRLSEIEHRIRVGADVPVLVALKIGENLFDIGDRSLDQAQLDAYCHEHCVETLIIDDL